MSYSTIYHTVNIFNEGRFVMDLDFDNKGDAIRESVSLQEEGFGTELITLSTANVFDTAPDDYTPESDRLAY
jgi:hypothetical protein